MTCKNPDIISMHFYGEKYNLHNQKLGQSALLLVHTCTYNGSPSTPSPP